MQGGVVGYEPVDVQVSEQAANLWIGLELSSNKEALLDGAAGTSWCVHCGKTKDAAICAWAHVLAALLRACQCACACPAPFWLAARRCR